MSASTMPPASLSSRSCRTSARIALCLPRGRRRILRQPRLQSAARDDRQRFFLPVKAFRAACRVDALSQNGQRETTQKSPWLSQALQNAGKTHRHLPRSHALFARQNGSRIQDPRDRQKPRRTGASTSSANRVKSGGGDEYFEAHEAGSLTRPLGRSMSACRAPFVSTWHQPWWPRGNLFTCLSFFSGLLRLPVAGAARLATLFGRERSCRTLPSKVPIAG